MCGSWVCTVGLVLAVTGCRATAGQASAGGAGDSEQEELRLNTACNQSAQPNAPAPFDAADAEGPLLAATDRAWSCGLHHVSSLDLRLTLAWSPAGCVESVTFHTSVPGAVGDCIERRFRGASTRPFSGEAPTVLVRFMNDRAFFEWQ